MYKILSNPNLSVALTLTLTILLSQSNIMNLFFDTILGRTLMVLIILCISYTNNILGVVTTLFVIMIFMCCYNYNDKFAATAPTSAIPSTTMTTPTSTFAPEPAISHAINDTIPDALDNNKYIVNEGFDILGTERTLQRGKKSNTIMVNEDMRKSRNVDPYDGWSNQSYFTSIN